MSIIDGISWPTTAARPGRRSRSWLRAVPVLGALATLAVGAVHLQQYLELYSAVPTIGTLFVLNFAAATVIGLALLAPVERLGAALVPLLALAAIGHAATSFVFLLISEHRPLFGFMEPGYDPPAIAAARGAEIATVVLLGGFLAARAGARAPMLAVAALAATAALAGCGGGGGDSGKATRPTVAVRQVDGVGRVLVDASGKALYSADVEADGAIRCTGACTSFWKPLTVDSGSPTAAPGVGALAVLKRPDGTSQVTAGGKPLYRFSQDAPGKVTGNGFTDDFGGRRFTWSAVLAGGSSAGTSNDRGNGYAY